MTLSLQIAALLSCAVLCSPQQSNSPDTNSQIVTIRLLSGQTGRPFQGEKPNVWLGDAKDPMNPATDSNGEIHLRIGRDQPGTLRFSLNQGVDCRYRKDQSVFTNPDYKLDDILSKGIVSENFCGKPRAIPAPGVLVIFARKPTFWEKWRD